MTISSGIITILSMEKINLSIKLKNRLTDLDKIKKAVSKMFTSITCSHRKVHEINLILEELFTNVVKHGFSDNKDHDINLSLSCDDTFLIIRMEDDGTPFDLTAAPAPEMHCALEKRCVGGLGIHFVKHFIDECHYSRKKDKNVVVLKKDMTTDEQPGRDSESK